MSTASDFDVLIIGGGMVGITLACALGQQQFRVGLLESRPPNRDWPPAAFDIRTSAITRASQQLFEEVGAWQGMLDRRVCAYREMRVWDATGHGMIHFDSAEIGEPDLGHIIENSVIQAALWDRAETLEGVRLICPATPSAMRVDEQQVQLTLDNGNTLSAALIVGADGGQSWVRQQAGFDRHGWSYEQQAVVAVITTELDHQDTAWQRFASDGPLAFLPLAENTCGIVWSTTPEHAQQLLALDKPAFLTELQESFGDALGKMLDAGERAAFPLRLSHTLRYTSPRIALVGDAAHSIHPLAGQGVNLGLADTRCLIATLANARNRQQDIGHALVLRRYERARKADNLLMMSVMDGFKRLFGNEQPLLRLMRNQGLNLTDHLSPIKRLIMRQALGSTQS